MAASKSRPKPSIYRYNDDSIWAKGQTVDGVMHGYWEWFHKGGGPRSGSGYFDHGVKTGEWIRYDKQGKVLKRIEMKPKAAAAKAKQPVARPMKQAAKPKAKKPAAKPRKPAAKAKQPAAKPMKQAAKPKKKRRS